MTVYDGNQTQLAMVSGAGKYGTTLTTTIPGISAGSTYYVKVAAADSTAFGTGKYALTLNMGTGASPTVPMPNTQTVNGNPPSGGGGQAFNKGIIQSVVGGLLGIVTGLLKDAAGVFDTLDTFEVGSQTQHFVTQVYQDLLARPVDSSGMQFWGGMLDTGILSRDQVVQGIQNSLEYRIVEVNTAYQQVLDRQADPSGLNTFVHFLQDGGTVPQLKAILGSSQEFINNAQSLDSTAGLTTANEKTVDYLFQKILNRSADSSGLAAFSSALDNDVAPLAVASAIVSSQEADRDQVNNLYSQFLKRQADGPGLDGFTQALLKGASLEAVVGGMVGSDEYFGLAQQA